jgi:hypothetical protein
MLVIIKPKHKSTGGFELKNYFYSMYIYNVTCNVAPEIHLEWIHWMKSTHIPEVLATACFSEARILKLMNIEDEGATYAIQYTYAQEADLLKYQSVFAPALQQKTKEKYGERVLAFRTYMEIIPI